MGHLSIRGLGKLQEYGAGHLGRLGAESLLSLHLDALFVYGTRVLHTIAKLVAYTNGNKY